MTPKEYIIEKINKAIKMFPSIRVRYEYNQLACVHSVEIVPQSIYDSEEMIDWQCDVLNEFAEKFPMEGLGFLSADALVGIDKVDYEACGILYGSPNINGQVEEPSFIINSIWSKNKAFSKYSFATTEVVQAAAFAAMQSITIDENYSNNLLGAA